MSTPEVRARFQRSKDNARRRRAEARQQKEEASRQRELRRAQMSPEERAADIDAERREPFIQDREKATRGLDLVAMALAGRSLDRDQRDALLGQCVYPPDATAFLRSLNGYHDRVGDITAFKRRACSTTEFVHVSPELCKFTLCDWRVPEDFNSGDDGNAAVQALYEEQLRLQREEDRLEKARDIARDHGPKRARYWAQQILDRFEAAAEKGEELRVYAAWDQIKPVIPFWIDNIRKSRENYGFVIYKSREVEERPAVATRRWLTNFNGAEESENFVGIEGAWFSVLGAWHLRPFIFSGWESPCSSHGFPSEMNASAFRKHFKLMAPSLSKPRVLNNTFLVLTNDCVFPELDTCDLEHGITEESEPTTVLPSEIPQFFLWAYDADWEPPNAPSSDVEISPSAGEGCTCKGAFVGGHNGADEDGYQGRVKVDIRILYSWFYYARLMEVNVKDLWRKAQSLPDQTWTCRAAFYDPSQPEALV